MTKNLILLGMLLASILAYTWYDNGAHQKIGAETPRQQTVLQEARNFSSTTMAGKKFELSHFKGKAIVLNFWASWCAPCVIEFPQMLTLAKKNPDTVFIFLSQDDDLTAINRFIKKQGPNAHLNNVIIGQDKGMKIAQDLYNTYKLPETFLIDSDHRIAGKIIGNSDDWTGPDMQKRITDLALRPR